MKNKSISDVVLVYDRYYTNKPDPITLSLKRVLLCCAMTMCAVMFVLTQYALPVSNVLCTVVSAVAAAVFSLLFIFVKKRVAIPTLLIVAGMLIWLRWESFCEKITYFTDSILLLCSGRFVDGGLLLVHYKAELSELNPEYIDGVTLGTVLLIILFAMITAAGMFSKPHVLPSFLSWIVLWVPLFLSERFTFNWWIIPAVALYMGAFASSLTYRQGLTLRSGRGGSYSNAAALNERSFMNRLLKSPYIKRVEMKSSYYSKYFSLTMYTAALFAAIGIVAGVVLNSSEGIDYSELYEFVTSIGSRQSFIDDPLFDDGKMDSYFSSPFDDSSQLSITSPGKSNREILKVINPGRTSVYLRGDYGIRFSGTGWDSPVNQEPYWWVKDGNLLKYNYRPVEMKILNSIMSRLDISDGVLESTDLTIDYLCDTNVVFLPAYTEEYSFYNSAMFDIYGDFVTRVDPAYSKIDKIECTALIPKYSNQDGSASPADLGYLERAVNAAYMWNFDSIMNSFLEADVVDKYREYVYGTFVEISSEKSLFMTDFMRSSGLEDQIQAIYGDYYLETLSAETKFRIADLICTYLVNNYSYSLDVDFGTKDPVESFLTETKTGHCALYATSMTLMLRTLGIPARYCTGFVAPANGYTETILRSRNLHAWCEVYLDELGWITFDPTSGSMFAYNPDPSGSGTNSGAVSGSNDPSSDQSDESSSSQRSDYSVDDDSEDSDPEDDPLDSSGDDRDNSYGESTQQRVNVMPYVLIILAFVAVTVTVIVVIRVYRSTEKRARNAVRRCCRDRNAVEILDKIIALLNVGGLTPKNGELPEKFYNRAEKTLRCAFSVNKDMLEAVAFGDRTIPQTDCEGLARLFEQLYNALDKKMNTFEKIKLWRIVL